MPRVFLLLLPLALTPIVLQSLQNRAWEMRLHMEMLQSLRLHRALDAEAHRMTSSEEPQTLPFIHTEEERDSLLKVVARGKPNSRYAEFSLVGCLDRSSGELAVQRGFTSPPPELCGAEL